jgi:hypothetical protein
LNKVWKHTLLFLLCVAAFAGFIDAVVGGGSDSGSILLPNLPVATAIGTTKTSFQWEHHLQRTIVKRSMGGLLMVMAVTIPSLLLGSNLLHL